MAMVAAACLPPGQFFAINSKQTLEWITSQGFPVTGAEMAALAARVGEHSVMGRVGGAPCLAVGMAEIFRQFAGGDRFADLWYHFAVMFEALFILTTLDAGTRIGRYLLSRSWVAKVFPRAQGSGYGANVLTSAAFVGGVGLLPDRGRDDPRVGSTPSGRCSASPISSWPPRR